MSKNIGGGRALRVCDLCGQVDDHPRHVIAGGDPGSFAAPSAEVIRKLSAAVADLAPADGDRLVASLMDTGSQDRHMDCCREAGCPDGSCDRITEGAEEKRGAALLKHLVKES